MTPDDQDKIEETPEVEAEATEAAADEAEAKPKRSRAKKATEETAAEETGVDKTAAAAEAEAEEKPKRRSRAKKADDGEAEGAADDGDAAAEEKADEGPTAAEVEAKASEEASESQPAAKKAPKSRAEKDKPETPAPPAPKRGRGRRGADNGTPAERVLVRAQARYVRTSARKARLVCDHIRGKDVVEARAILAFTPRGAAKPWLKLLESAIANAEHNHELVGDELRIDSVYADEGPTLKRYRPRAMGRATRIRKRTSHLTITLTPKEF
jgi:ribosomal protein L22